VLRDRIPMAYRSRLARARVRARQPTAGLRVLPSFMLIGAQRAGTSSLYRYLSAHPQVRKPLRKEIDWFSRDYDRPWSWYRAHFPLRLAGGVTLDATPQYLVHPLAPARVRERFPDIRLVVAVRDPVERALSQYRLMRQVGVETLEPAEALAAEAGRIAPDLERLRHDPLHKPLDLLRYSYVTRSRYGEQMERWLSHLPREQFHVLCFDTFEHDPGPEWDALLDFVGLDRWRPAEFANRSTRTRRTDVESGVRSMIEESLGGDPQRFATLVGRSFAWAPVRSA
jgi:hypothetical protein